MCVMCTFHIDIIFNSYLFIKNNFFFFKFFFFLFFFIHQALQNNCNATFDNDGG